MDQYLFRCYGAVGMKAYTRAYYLTFPAYLWAGHHSFRDRMLQLDDKDFMAAARRSNLHHELTRYLLHPRSQYHPDTLFRKYDGTHTDSIVTATRTGQKQLVQEMLSRDPTLLNRCFDDCTLVYHAAFCGHADLLNWLLEQGGNADWQRTYKNSCDRIRPVVKSHMKMLETREAAAALIQKHLHAWMWKPVTNDGKIGINARLLLTDLQEIIPYSS